MIFYMIGFGGRNLAMLSDFGCLFRLTSFGVKQAVLIGLLEEVTLNSR